MKQYPKMKDSGIEWIGDMPEHWEITKGRFFLTIYGGISSESIIESENGFHYFKVEDLNHVKQNLVLENSLVRIKPIGNSVPSPSILIPKRGEAINTNKVAICKVACYFDSNIMGLRVSDNYDIKFVAYALLTRTLSDLTDKSTIPQINNKHIKPLVFPNTSKNEQQQIADFLDKQTSKIDSEIQKNRKLIELLKEKKQTTINQVVTKGLDPNVPMKDSGIEWIGEIPEYWNELPISILRQMNLIFDLQDGNHGELHPKGDDFSSEGRPFLTANQIDDYGNIDFDTTNRLPEEFCKKLRIGFSQANDILFTHNATVGRVGIMPEYASDSIVGTSVTYYRLDNTKLDRYFFAYVLKSDYVSSQYEPIMRQSTRNQFSIEKQAKLKILLPPISEQREIANHITSKIQRIDNLIKITQIQIEKLQEYRQALVSEAVTGKIDVR
jgi:type I restriction enzyme S subunit